MAAFDLSRRQVSDNGNGDLYTGDYWWYSSTAYTIKWAVAGTLLGLCFLYFLGAYIHARRRMKRGLMPLAYHRWLVPRRQREGFAASHPQYQNQFAFQNQGNGQTPAYSMGNYAPPPPAYEPGYVPAYAPAQGPKKVDPDQTYTAPPPGNPGPSAYLGPDTGPSQPERVANPYKQR